METKVCLECGKEKRIETFGTSKNMQYQKSGKVVVRRKNICQTCFSKRQKARVQLSMLERLIGSASVAARIIQSFSLFNTSPGSVGHSVVGHPSKKRFSLESTDGIESFWALSA